MNPIIIDFDGLLEILGCIKGLFKNFIVTNT